jgi:recombination protein RecT
METALTTIKEQFPKIREKFLKLANEETFIRECSFAIQHLNKNPYLQKATQESILESVMNIANTGLTLNPVLKLAYMIPRYNSVHKEVQCVLEPSYQGLVKLITDTGSARNVFAHVVYEGDEFEEILGTEPSITHKPKHLSTKITFAYAVAVLFNGSRQIEVMTKAEINDIRDKSESYKAYKDGKVKSCIWVSDEGEMCRKTVIKRLTKYLPKTDQWDKLATAIDIDNKDYSISNDQASYIESLLQTCSLPVEEVIEIEKSLNTINSGEASKMITYLQNNQRDPIASGDNYSQSDIKKKMRAHV